MDGWLKIPGLCGASEIAPGREVENRWKPYRCYVYLSKLDSYCTVVGTTLVKILGAGDIGKKELIINI